MNCQNTKARTIMKELKCTVCGDVFPIQRRINRNRAKGHIKHLWCLKCREVTAHKEI